MLLSKTNIKMLTPSKGWVRNISRHLNSNNVVLSTHSLRFTTIRSYTSSFSNGKGHDSNNNQNQSTKDEEEKIANKKDTQQEPFVSKQPSTIESNFSFMPVINIPQTEFAHNAFFSLHRPLLGLADEEEKPFFSKHAPEDDDGKWFCCTTDN
ncbi:hypothetical protein BC941DRAFT_409575 [Chlamydoabsidia padenii]|nr:hypothetical protein BC941DRAFT_409575 [Chlamydoabsidia padenii]